jgi:tripartite-type tricarboxylate transporter receptor subunit TctC
MVLVDIQADNGKVMVAQGKMIAGVIGIALTCTSGLAQEYPSRPITLIVPSPEGGIVDAHARAVARYLSSTLAQKVIVENRAGGARAIGEAAARAEADGYTLLFATSQTLGVLPAVSQTTYDPIKTYAPVAQISQTPIVFVVNTSIPVDTCPNFVQRAKDNAGSMQFSSSGVGSLSHINGELFRMRAGITISHAPYRSDSAAIASVVAGESHLIFQSLNMILSDVNARRLNPLGVASNQRNARLPNVPTMIECGYPGFASSNWNSVLAPAKTPDAIVGKLNTTLNAGLNGELGVALAELLSEPLGGSAQQLAFRIAAEQAKWGAIVKEANIKPE